MKLLIASALLFFFAATTTVNAQQTTTKQHRAKTMLKTNRTTTTSDVDRTDNGVPVSSAGAEVSGVTGSAPGDPYNLAHPYFNGEPRWSHPDTLYKHGDFPWAMVAKHPENFNFNAATGQWEVVNGASMGSSRQSR
jgi:hypothetical protein